MREPFGKGLSRSGAHWRGPADELHLRYAAASVPFDRLCFPEELQRPSLGTGRLAWTGDAR
jgi:hypothetical protein